MCDMEVIITNGEYRDLKKCEEDNKKLRGKVKDVEIQCWELERLIKDKDQMLEKNCKQIKELSKNAIHLSKRVLMSDEMIGKQEEKWIKR